MNLLGIFEGIDISIPFFFAWHRTCFSFKRMEIIVKIINRVNFSKKFLVEELVTLKENKVP
ncbi:hypothetical protein [Bacillus cereus]|uniref:hypothetical protein n=1 Tax=Bacillus cereus TaxID=1396 RepID=UPI001E3B23D8|nr:hypothetical protein [Bacillus cereus]MCC2454348.1 hypothetical protein [Bacillus cereus]MCU5079052.1 hypothetical protein [Bacillus cereus]